MVTVGGISDRKKSREENAPWTVLPLGLGILKLSRRPRGPMIYVSETVASSFFQFRSSTSVEFLHRLASGALLLLVFTINVSYGDSLKVLVYSRTTGFRHDSIPAGIEAIQNIGINFGFEVVSTEDPAVFNDQQLADFDAVVFLQTTGNPLDGTQRTAFEHFIETGKGMVGLHAAADVDGTWPWYVELLGARFASHPAIQTATMEISDFDHPSTQHLDSKWQRNDEWYNFANLQPDIQV